MTVEVVGTSAGAIRDAWSLAGDVDAAGVSIASAYWDERVIEHALQLANGAPVSLLLWVAGGKRSAWEVLARDHGDVDLRFIDSPAAGGIFHAKVVGLTDTSGAWTCAFVGSANMTTAALMKNVELGVVIRDEPEALTNLQDWFQLVWSAAIRAPDFDFATAIDIAPTDSEAAKRRKLFASARLAPPAPTG